MSRTSAREALVGRTIAGRYVLRALIGGGGMGAVYRAEHAGGEVALKLIDAELAKKPAAPRVGTPGRISGGVS